MHIVSLSLLSGLVPHVIAARILVSRECTTLHRTNVPGQVKVKTPTLPLSPPSSRRLSSITAFRSSVIPCTAIFLMESRIIANRSSARRSGDDSRHTQGGAEAHDAQQAAAKSSASSSLLDPRAQLTMERFLQDLPNAEEPPQEFPPQYHTGRLPNSKAGDGKPRLLLMGQRR